MMRFKKNRRKNHLFISGPGFRIVKLSIRFWGGHFLQNQDLWSTFADSGTKEANIKKNNFEN